MKPDAPFTPGRVSYVYFSHRDMVEDLKDKPPGWSQATCGGLFPWLMEDHVIGSRYAPARRSSRRERRAAKKAKGKQKVQDMGDEVDKKAVVQADGEAGNEADNSLDDWSSELSEICSTDDVD